MRGDGAPITSLLIPDLLISSAIAVGTSFDSITILSTCTYIHNSVSTVDPWNKLDQNTTTEKLLPFAECTFSCMEEAFHLSANPLPFCKLLLHRPVLVKEELNFPLEPQQCMISRGEMSKV